MPPSIPAPPTVVSLKQDFLSTQTRVLSQPLTPSRAWRASNDANDNGNEDDLGVLPDKAIDDALWGLNHRLQQHAKRVYSRRATRHIAEQIDQLYWDATNGGERDGGGDENGEGGEELTLGADLGRWFCFWVCLLVWFTVDFVVIRAWFLVNPTLTNSYSHPLFKVIHTLIQHTHLTFPYTPLPSENKPQLQKSIY